MSRSRKITVGIDIGSTTSKAVMLIDGQVASFVSGGVMFNQTTRTAGQALEAASGYETDLP